jgi:pimeloyl-ACP methyl ester carboxylesterase
LIPSNQIDAGVLNVSYAAVGPLNGSPVILLHGWPYDIHTYGDEVQLLAAKNYRVIVPYLRGYGTSQFLSANTFRRLQRKSRQAIMLMEFNSVEKHGWYERPAYSRLHWSKLLIIGMFSTIKFQNSLTKFQTAITQE